jgi:catechol 2,3-dioxygenase-like lactoylglutathione lyase family enzyme
VINAIHSLVYCEDAEAARAFFRDVIGWPYVDTGHGWLIFKTGPSELGVHPNSWEHEGERGTTDQRHEISLVCDDIVKTVAELAGKGAIFTRVIRDDGFGHTIDLKIPGGPEIMLYEPKYALPALADI